MHSSFTNIQEEHNDIKTMLRIIESACSRLENKQDVSVEDLKKMSSFINAFIEDIHHSGEEEIVAPKAMAKDEATGSSLASHLYPKEEGRRLIDEIISGISRYEAERDPSHFINNAKAYSTLVRDQIAKEEEQLYPELTSDLETDEVEAMLQELVDRKNAKINNEDSNNIKEILSKLMENYLNNNSCCGNEAKDTCCANACCGEDKATCCGNCSTNPCCESGPSGVCDEGCQCEDCLAMDSACECENCECEDCKTEDGCPCSKNCC